MSVIMDGDFTTLDPADSTTGWTGRSPISNLSIDTVGNIEGSGAIEGRLASGTGDATYNHGTTDFTDAHLFCWFRPSSPVDTFVNAGVTMRISGTASGATNYGQWVVGGSDVGIIGSGGWINYLIDILQPFDSINGTPPAITAPVDSGIGGKFLSGPGMAQVVIDRLQYGNVAIVRGGTGGSPGLWAEAATADLANGHIKEIAGAIFINCRVRFGDSVGVTATEFDDKDGVVLFETNMIIAGDLCGFEFAGNATGMNNAIFGVASGTGVDKIGGSGGVWKAAGDRPFRVEAKDSNMDAVGIFGVSMLGPAALWDDNLRNFKQEDNSLASFLDFTREANDSTANDASPFPTGAGTNDAVYFGHNVRWYELNVNTGTVGAGTYTVAWEYYNGTSWVALIDLTDGTGAFKTSGLQTVTFSVPDDWAKVTVDTDSRYWIRARRDGGTVTTDPDITQASIALAGDIELEVSNAEMIDCVLSSMGAVRIRGGAFCKRTSISSSLATAKHGALDLGSADPAADTVRDLTIQNCNKGILLKGTSTGTTTYNFRNIQFSNNTKDVRVDFPAGATITINILEGGDTPTLDNVNSSTVNIVAASVTVKVTAITDASVLVANAQVVMKASDGTGPFPFEETVTITRSGAVATVTHTAHGMDTNDYILIRDAVQQEYNIVAQITKIDANSYSYTVSGTPVTPATGTITGTFVALAGLTDGSGILSVSRVYSADQPVTGYARKSTASPFYRQGALSGTILAASGYDKSAVMVSDE